MKSSFLAGYETLVFIYIYIDASIANAFLSLVQESFLCNQLNLWMGRGFGEIKIQICTFSPTLCLLL